MATIEPSVLANSVMGKLYNVLTNGDDTVPKSEDAFFSWMTPGVPVEPSELEFLSQGFTGVIKKRAVEAMREAVLVGAGGEEAEAPPPPPAATPLTQEQLDALMAQDAGRMYVQAESLARLLDFVPDVTSATNNQFARMSVHTNDGTLSDIYDFTLRMSQVMESQLPEDLQKKIEKMRSLLQKIAKKKDLITDEEVEVTEPSELQKAYFQKMAAYDAAALEYNARRIDALTATNQRAVHDWAINANIYRNKVRAAMADWISNGYKEDYEKIAAFLEQVSRRDMSLLKQAYAEDLERARLTSPISGADFFFTGLVPGNFAESTGWTRFGFEAGDFASHSDSSFSTSKWQASGGGGWLGIFSASASGGSSQTHSEYHSSFDSSQTHMSFEIAQIPIARPWFRTAFLTSHSWRFDQNNPTVKTNVLSDGGTPPKGMMPAYPVTAIFVRKLELRMGESHSFQNWLSDQRSSSVGGSASFPAFGPFSLSAGGSRSTSSSSSSSDAGYRFQNDTMFVDGMQLIGFKCHIMPKSPDPDPAITAWI
jgi:hypothetical protein